MGRPKKVKDDVNVSSATNEGTKDTDIKKDNVSEPNLEVEALKAEVEKLKQTLYAVADAGRLMNFENQQNAGKKPMKVNLSRFSGGVIIGWRTEKDELIKHPTTGRVVGEEQLYELLIWTKDEGVKKIMVNGYPAFSEARYSDRFEAEVVGKKESWSGVLTFEVLLPEGNTINIDSPYVN